MKIDQVSDSVHVVAGTNVNWALIDDGSGVTVIDAGYPADTADVLDSIHQIGRRPADVRAVLITHAHLDHIGAIPTLIEQAGMPVYTGAEEVRHAKREYLQQITPTGMLKQLANRRGRRWVAHTLLAVRGHTGMAIPRAETGARCRRCRCTSVPRGRRVRWGGRRCRRTTRCGHRPPAPTRYQGSLPAGE
ncbi:MBL fold metallo-hydrolase [Nocardia nova]